MPAIRVTIDEKKIETASGTSLLEAALNSGIYIPHLCHHPDLKPVGTCGMCVVEIAGIDELTSACMTEVQHNMSVVTRSAAIDAARRKAMSVLLTGHPPECTDCSKYLNCELQSLKQFVGMDDGIADHNFKPLAVNRDNPLFVHDPVRCIKCGRCVRACNDLRGAAVLQMVGEEEEKHVEIPDGKTLAEAGCRFCGACVEVCPTGAMRDDEKLMEGKKRREALIPCKFSCPAQINVPRYVRLVGQKKYAQATAVIREKVPFPLVLGHVCNHPCEEGCRRSELNEAIAIRDLKRFAVENDDKRLWQQNSRVKAASGNRVAVIGAGPAGLTAAFYLAKLGHALTVFEALPQAGGMLRYGIPAYRLPREVLDREIDEIKNIGVKIETDTKIESIQDLMDEEDFDAVLVAVGSHAGQKLPIPGADADGIYIGTDFLRSLNMAKLVAVGKQVVVLGGGNVAFDCARMARRMGADKVQIACLETKTDMPAACDEIDQGEQEGIVVHDGRTFTRILEKEGRVCGIECLKVASFEFDEDGIPEIETVDGSDHVLAADTLIFAIGQRPQIPEDFDLDLNERGHIDMDPYTFDTNLDGVFAAGDAVHGSASVIAAIASGRQGAAALDKYLNGDGNLDEQLASAAEVSPWLGPGPGFAALNRSAECCLSAEERLSGFDCVLATMDETAALSESNRCLRCDLRLKITPVKFWADY